jgi:hypothetical protein
MGLGDWRSRRVCRPFVRTLLAFGPVSDRTSFAGSKQSYRLAPPTSPLCGHRIRMLGRHGTEESVLVVRSNRGLLAHQARRAVNDLARDRGRIEHPG